MSSDVDDQRFRLDGRTALVTGGSRGLGKAMVLAFARAGADVVIASRRLERCEEVAAAVRSSTGRRALAVACHVGRWNEVEQLATRAYDEYGSIDVLVNNAGLSPTYPSADSVTEDLFDKVIDVNLKGPFRLTALVGARMAAGRGGSIINVSSLAAERPDRHSLPYAAAKAGLNALTVGFAQAFGPSVRVNAILPGPFATDISEAWSPKALESIARRLPLGRPGDPDEIVGTAIYLATDASSFTTGAMIRVDGGSP